MRIFAVCFLVWTMAAATISSAEKLVPTTQLQMQLSFAPVVREASPAVVNIYATRVVAEQVSPFAGDPFFSQFFGFGQSVPRLENSLGSGVIVGADGIVVSNYHVVGDAREIRVVLSDRREFAGEILLSDQDTDIAVIKLQDSDNLPTIELANSDAVQVGDLVLAIGNPFGVGQTVTSGIISGLARSGANVGSQAGYYIQTDAPINPGNSGGALVDMQGQLIGINTSILTRSGGSNGIGFAIPSNMVMQYIAQARAGHTAFIRPWSGLAVQQVDDALADALDQNVPTGAMITEIHPKSPFAAANMQPGDVILSINDLPVNGPAELEFRLSTSGLGSDAAIRFLRDGTPSNATVAVAQAPDTPDSAPFLVTASSPFNGLVVARVNPKFISDLDLPLSSQGVIVLQAEGYASRIGLRPGDTIVRINGTKILAPSDIENAATTDTSSWEIEIQRDGRMVRVRLQI